MARNSRNPDWKNLYLEIECLEERRFLDASMAFPIDIMPVDTTEIGCDSKLAETDCVPVDEISDPVIIEEGTPGTQTVETEVDDQGRVIFESTSFDDNGDGVTDWSFSYQYSYNEQGQVTSEIYQEDYDGDGNADYISTSTSVYDENGNVISSVWSSDDDGDGNADYSSTSTNVYDDNGNLISSVWSSDDNGDGNADYISTSTNVYDDTGNLISSIWMSDYNGDGTFDDVSRITTDADGVVTYEEDYDEDFDGDIDFRLVSSYDAAGNELSYQTWTDSDGDGNFTETTADNQVDLSDPPSDVVIYDFMKSNGAPAEVTLEPAITASLGGAPEIISAAVQSVDSSVAGFYFAPAKTDALGTSTGLSAIAFSASPSAFTTMLVFAPDSAALPSSDEADLTINNADDSAGLLLQTTKLATDGHATISMRVDAQVQTDLAKDLTKDASILAI